MHCKYVAGLGRVYILADLRDSARLLVTRDEGLVFPGFDLIEEVEVRPADPRCEDLHQDVLSARLRVRELNDLDGAARLEPNRAHGGVLVRSRSRRFVLLASVPGCEMPRNIDQGDRNRKVPEIRAGPAAGDSVAGTGGMWGRGGQKTFLLSGGLGGPAYMALFLLFLGVPLAIMGGVFAGGGVPLC